MYTDDTRRMVVFLLIFVSLACIKNCVGVSSPAAAKNDVNKEESNRTVENILLTVATIIQRCVDESTMNNKTFKKELDVLYANSVEAKITKMLKKYKKKVKSVRKKFEEDKQLLKIIEEQLYPVKNKKKQRICKKKKKTINYIGFLYCVLFIGFDNSENSSMDNTTILSSPEYNDNTYYDIFVLYYLIISVRR